MIQLLSLLALVQSPAAPELQTVYWDGVDDHGRLFGGTLQIDVPPKGSVRGVLPAGVESLTHGILPPNSANRLDLVFVGDGYTSAQLGTYATHVNNIVGSFFDLEPYRTYEPYFLIHRVDVTSNQSGVDNDPTQGILKDTAMDMGYWCGGTERALCVDTTKAYQFANNAPGVDLVCAIANSSKYGGVGYPSINLATSAGNNGSAIEIVRHEFGHALGHLADEYDYGGSGSTYTGGEPGSPNISKLTAAQMTAMSAKWFRWIGVNNAAFDGLVSSFQGAGYYPMGLYRPTNDSLMRSLGRPFNLPSAEAVVLEIYTFTRPIDDSSSTTATYAGTETLFVTPMAQVGAALRVQWSLNGAPIPGATGTTLALAPLGLACPATVSVTVTDPTTMVRDEAARAALMTQTLSFAVVPVPGPITSSCVAAPNSVGPGASMSWGGSSSVTANDLTLVASGCPTNAAGLFYAGQTAAQVPFGNGFRCIGGPTVRLGIVHANLFGDAVLALDLNAWPGAAPIQTGDTWRFQLWYRNPAGGGAGFNLSDLLNVRFCP